MVYCWKDTCDAKGILTPKIIVPLVQKGLKRRTPNQ